MPPRPGRAGLGLVRVLEPARYEPGRYLPDTPAFAERLARLDPVARMRLAEDLAGNMRTHVVYAARAGDTATEAEPGAELRVWLRGVEPRALAASVAKAGRVRVTIDGLDMAAPIPRRAAPLIALARPGARLAEMAAGGLSWPRFASEWAPVDRALRGFNLIHYSAGARR